MAYSFQTFSVGQVLTAAQMNAVEVNIRDHGHGLAGVLMAIPTVAAGGTVDAITATYSPVMDALVQGVIVGVEASGANATTTPTFNPNALGAKTIVKTSDQALVPGDISGANFVAYLRYDLSLDKWQLINPATGGSGGSISFVAAGGTVNVITATFVPAIPALYNGLIVQVECAGANTIAEPTLNVSALGAKTIVKNSNEALVLNDIPGANYVGLFRYDISLDKFQLLNPKSVPEIGWARLSALGAVLE